MNHIKCSSCKIILTKDFKKIQIPYHHIPETNIRICIDCMDILRLCPIPFEKIDKINEKEKFYMVKQICERLAKDFKVKIIIYPENLEELK